jgi:hypothetical protein
MPHQKAVDIWLLRPFVFTSGSTTTQAALTFGFHEGVPNDSKKQSNLELAQHLLVHSPQEPFRFLNGEVSMGMSVLTLRLMQLQGHFDGTVFQAAVAFLAKHIGEKDNRSLYLYTAAIVCSLYSSY